MIDSMCNVMPCMPWFDHPMGIVILVMFDQQEFNHSRYKCTKEIWEPTVVIRDRLLQSNG